MKEFSDNQAAAFSKSDKIPNIKANNALGTLKKQKKFMTADVEC